MNSTTTEKLSLGLPSILGLEVEVMRKVSNYLTEIYRDLVRDLISEMHFLV